MTSHCSVCKGSQKLLNCSGCKQIAYCGVEHQKSDWAKHKLVCKKLQEAEKNGFAKEIMKEGTGDLPETRRNVTVHYKGYLVNGDVFDSSIERNEPFTFKLGQGQVIKGWDEGVATMKQGEKAKLFISSRYGYGEDGAGEDIPGGSSLIFEVERL